LFKEKIIVRILDKAYDFLDHEQIEKLRNIFDEELCHYTVILECTDLVIQDNLTEMILLYAASKRLAGISLKTIRNYLVTLKRFATAMRRDVDKIGIMDLRMYLAQYTNTGIMNSTLATCMWQLKSFFAWLHDEEYIPKNPMRKLKVTKVEKRMREYLTQIELEYLRIACETKRELALVEVFYSTGCRLEEIHQLNRKSINWYSDSCKVIGKGNKERTVFINAKAKVHLQRYLDSRKDKSEALFVSERLPHDRLSCRSIEEAFEKLGERSEIDKHIHPHIFRHSFAMNMLKSGASIAAIQQFLGHENAQTTLIYASFNDEELQIIHKKCS
jgi:integrase/recombinase XerD